MWRKGTDSLWKHRVKSSTCHIGHEQLAKPAMLPSSCGKATTCSTQLSGGWPGYKAGEAVASVAKSVEGGQVGRGCQDWRRGWVCTAWSLVVDGGKGGEPEVKRRRRRKSRKNYSVGRDGTRRPLRSSNNSDSVEKSDLYIADLSRAGA